MNNKKYVDIIYIYIDLSKAFDVVSYDKLLYKLKSYGISNKIINWFYNFLSNRSQITRVENSFSSSFIVKPGDRFNFQFYFSYILIICLVYFLQKFIMIADNLVTL